MFNSRPLIVELPQYKNLIATKLFYDDPKNSSYVSRTLEFKYYLECYQDYPNQYMIEFFQPNNIVIQWYWYRWYVLGSNYTKQISKVSVPFEEVFEKVPNSLQTEMIWHLDILTKPGLIK